LSFAAQALSFATQSAAENSCVKEFASQKSVHCNNGVPPLLCDEWFVMNGARLRAV